MTKNIKNLTLPLLLVTVLASADAVVEKSPFTNDPILKDFQKLQSDMNRVFENFNKHFFKDLKIPEVEESGFSTLLKTDVKDKGDHYEIKANLPGVDKNVIKVEIKDNILSIDAKTQKEEKKEEDGKVIKQERFIGAYHRSMSIPKDANADKMKTDYKDGVLTITIPKK